jgi:Fe-S-cluster-containing hydrogenase component 2
MCEVTCSFFKEKECNPAKSRIRVAKNEEEGLDTPIVCRQCGKPPCAEACPVGAIHKDEKTSIVLINEEKCVGCASCVEACPFNSMFFDVERNVAIKCDQCSGDPACVKSCTRGALEYVRADRAALLKAQESLENRMLDTA